MDGFFLGWMALIRVSLLSPRSIYKDCMCAHALSYHTVSSSRTRVVTCLLSIMFSLFYGTYSINICSIKLN